ncbi:hypothetical protein GCM10010523_15920 [Paenarthrobacter ilicis]
MYFLAAATTASPETAPPLVPTAAAPAVAVVLPAAGNSEPKPAAPTPETSEEDEEDEVPMALLRAEAKDAASAAEAAEEPEETAVEVLAPWANCCSWDSML